MTYSRKPAAKQTRTAGLPRRLIRFEVLGLATDRELIRSLAQKLADNGAEASKLRAAVTHLISVTPTQKGRILTALRRSPLVGVDLGVRRAGEEVHEIEL